MRDTKKVLNLFIWIFNMAKATVQYNGIGFGGLLTIVFIVLKLTGYIAWSWWWVFAPIWIPFGIAITILIFVILIGAIVGWKKGLL